jgi:hypothetical protein
MKSLIRRYPSLKDENNSEYVLQNRTIFVDDIANNIIQYRSRQLVCPKYNYWNQYDIYDRLITTYKIDPLVFNDKDILDFLHYKEILVYNENGNEYQKNKEYIAIAKTYHAIHNEIEKSQDNKNEDTYFKDLIKELSKKTISDDCLTDKNIAMLNVKLLK